MALSIFLHLRPWDSLFLEAAAGARSLPPWLRAAGVRTCPATLPALLTAGSRIQPILGQRSLAI